MTKIFLFSLDIFLNITQASQITSFTSRDKKMAKIKGVFGHLQFIWVQLTQLMTTRLRLGQNRPGNPAAAFWEVITTSSLHTFAGWRPPPQQSYWRGNTPTSATPVHTLAFRFQLTQKVFVVRCGTEQCQEGDDPGQRLTGSSHGWSTIFSLQQWFRDKFKSPPSTSHCSAQ